MNDNWSPNNWMLSEKTYLIVLETHVRVSEWVRNQISQIPQMSLLLERSTMSFAERIVMRPRGNTSVCQVSKFMNVNSVFTVWTETLDWTCDLDGSCCILLAERNDTPNFRVVWVQYANGISCGLWSLWFVHEVGNWACGASKGRTEFS